MQEHFQKKQKQVSRNEERPKSKESELQEVNDALILHANMDGYQTHAIDVEAEIALLASQEREPDIVLLNETKLDEGSKDPVLSGYVLICRRDRISKNRGGGIAIFARETKAAHVTLLGVSDICERCWIMLHTNDGPFLIGCWYRPPNKGNTDGINELRDEKTNFRSNAVGVIIVGDINVHSVKWLRHSAGETKEAHVLQTVCEEMGLKQRVNEPTRKDIPSGKDYLLDLVLSDIPVEARVGNTIRDHRFVFTRMNVRIPDTQVIEREVWNYKKADWTRLKECLADHDWSCL